MCKPLTRFEGVHSQTRKADEQSPYHVLELQVLTEAWAQSFTEPLVDGVWPSDSAEQAWMRAGVQSPG
ncbi:hypothetical protein WJX82_007640 [Trebouxia sp. C0006]